MHLYSTMAKPTQDPSFHNLCLEWSLRSTNHWDLITSDPDCLDSKPNRIPSFGIYLAWIHDSIPFWRPG